MKMNLPNQLTIARIIITPFFLAALLWEALPHRFLIATAIYAVGAITDAVDGHLARKNGQVTNFGKLLDPIADKILTTSALVYDYGALQYLDCYDSACKRICRGFGQNDSGRRRSCNSRQQMGKGQNCQSNDLYDYNNASLRGGLYSRNVVFKRAFCGGKYLVHIAAYFKFAAVDNRRSDSSFGCYLLKGQ